LIKRPTGFNLFGSVVRMVFVCLLVTRTVQCASGMLRECRSNLSTNWAQRTSFKQTATTTTA